MAERSIDPLAVKAQLRRLLRRQQTAAAGPWLHGEVARRMAGRLPLIRLRPTRLVEWWGSLGCSDQLLRDAYPDAVRTVVEADSAWLEQTRRQRQLPWWATRRWRGEADALISEDDPLPADAHQLVWANMVLQGVVDPPQLLARWHRTLQVDGFLMFSSLGPDTLRQLRALYASLGWAPPAVDFIDMHDLGDMLLEAGFADPVMDQETLTLTWATAQEMLAELRSLGGNVSPQRQRGLRTPRWQQQLLLQLERLRGADGRLQLSFEVAYGHAFKAPPRRPAADQTTVSLEEMRQLARQPRKPPVSG